MIDSIVAAMILSSYNAAVDSGWHLSVSIGKICLRVAISRII